MTMLTQAEQGIPRDRFQRPLVIPPKGGKPVAYTRCTTYVGCLEDTYNLSRWQQRMVAIGLSERPDLLLQITATDNDDKKAINEICEAAMEAAKAHAAATVGTSLHALTEMMDRQPDRQLPSGVVVPDAYQADLDAYRDATQVLEHVHIEQFSVLDDLKIGGTPDRVVEYGGQLVIADLKTGSIDWGLGKIAMQLAVYAHAVRYDHTDGSRHPWGDDVNLHRAIIIHLPAGSGKCELVPVDINAGWDAVQLATDVRAWRQRKDLKKPFGTLRAKPLTERIATAKSVDELALLWAENTDDWTDDLTALAAERKALLQGGVVSATEGVTA